ncbi:MAG: DnaJ family molecular chaperone [Rubricoccaceae bacterium]
MSGSLLALLSAVVVTALLGSVLLGWLADLRRVRGATSAWQSRGEHEERIRSAFRQAAAGGGAAGPGTPGRGRRTPPRGDASRTYGYASARSSARAQAFGERIHRERMAREQARRRAEARAQQAAASGGGPRAARPQPLSDEARHRRTLDLTGDITPALLRRQYRLLIAAYHPDRVASLGIKLRRLAEEETKAINEAYAYFKQRLGA